MPETKPAKRNTSAAASFTDEEREAMKERAREVKASRGKNKVEEGRAQLREKIEEMTGADREMAEKVHEIVTRVAPDLEQRTWYGMPAYYKDGKVLCFFQSSAKFKARYATFGFDESAKLDEGSMWATSFALTNVGAAEERRIEELVRRAIG
jgi:uncharacterized protein YdhG (YjbR/CyaY superfamily)